MWGYILLGLFLLVLALAVANVILTKHKKKVLKKAQEKQEEREE